MSEALNTLGVEFDNLTTIQRNALTLPAKGMLIWHLDENRLEINKGTAAVPKWEPVNYVPTDYTGNAGNVIAVNGTEDALVFAEDKNTWDITNAAFVDPATGNNGTAVVGDGNKPYLNVSTALSNADFVILKPGNYTEFIFITADNKHVHAMDGVRVISNGVYVSGTGVNNFKFSGKAVFDGFSAFMLRVVNTAATIDFECAYALECNRIYFHEGSAAIIYSPTVRMSFDFARCNGFNGGGYAIRHRANANVVITAKHYIESQHSVLRTMDGASGKVVFNCPELRIIDNYTSSYGTANKDVIKVEAFSRTPEIIVNGNLNQTYSSAGTGLFDTRACLNMAQVTVAPGPKITINGDMTNDLSPCVVSGYQSAFGEVYINGNMHSKGTTGGFGGSPFWLQLTGWGAASNQKFIIKNSSIQGSSRLIIGRGKFVSFADSYIYNSDPGAQESNFFLEQTGTTLQELYLYNTICETNIYGEGTELVKGNSIGATVSTVQTKGNVPLSSTYIDEWSEYIYNTDIIVPKL